MTYRIHSHHTNPITQKKNYCGYHHISSLLSHPTLHQKFFNFAHSQPVPWPNMTAINDHSIALGKDLTKLSGPDDFPDCNKFSRDIANINGYTDQ
jgi:hypothetical protein